MLDNSMLTILTDEETLELVAKDGEMDYDKWPALLEPLLERLDQVSQVDFMHPICIS